MSEVFVSVVIPTHDPVPATLARTLAGLGAQTLPAAQREIIVVDNASTRSVATELAGAAVPGLRVVHEPALGLTRARLRGFAEARGELLVLVDDDNVLAPDYLARARARFAAEPALGAAGGKSLPEFAVPPAAWAHEFTGLLAVRDHGEAEERAAWRAGEPRAYPRCSPLGAGMVLRRRVAQAYAAALAEDPRRAAFDRTGRQLVSGGDNDLVMTALEAGCGVAYFPELVLTHLIPARRLERDYLGALNRAIMRSWVRVLALHGIVLWPPVSRASVPLRQARAWWRTRAWAGPAEWIRWQGRCGQFEGQADIAGARP